MRVIFLLSIFATAMVGCREDPSWPAASIRRPDLCRMVQLNAVIVALQIQSVNKAIKIEMSPWPKEPFWTTPLQVLPSQILVDSRLPHETEAIAAGTAVNGYFTGPLTMPTTQETIVGAATPIDGVWVFDLNAWMTFSQKPEGWRRTDLEDDLVYPSLKDLQNALRAAVSSGPTCARYDWVGETRQANQDRQKAAMSPPVRSATGPDGGP